MEGLSTSRKSTVRDRYTSTAFGDDFLIIKNIDISLLQGVQIR
jgi:hypothetical protein